MPNIIILALKPVTRFFIARIAPARSCRSVSQVFSCAPSKTPNQLEQQPIVSLCLDHLKKDGKGLCGSWLRDTDYRGAFITWTIKISSLISVNLQGCPKPAEKLIHGHPRCSFSCLIRDWDESLPIL